MPRRTRRLSAQSKFKAVIELLRGARSATAIARTYQVHPNSLNLWKQTLLERGPELFEGRAATSEYEKRVADLERMVGKKEVELALLKNFWGRSA